VAATQGVDPFLKATLPTHVLRHRGLSLHQRAPGSSPYDTGAGSHTTCKLAWDRSSQTAARGASNRPAVTSTPPSLPKTSGRKGGPPCRWHATAPRGCTLSTSTHPAWRPRPTRHVTGAPVTTCEKLHRHLLQCRASSTTEPMPRLEATLRMAQQCQPSASVTGQSTAGEGTMVDMTKSGPAVMAATGERKQQSNCLQAHVPLLEQQGSPLPRREDDAPVFRPSNGSRNGCPANHPSRRINSAAGQAAPLAGEAGDTSPPP
jgi:hypothetical protein